MSFNAFQKPTQDFIYYNVRINGNIDGSLALASFNESRSIPIVDNPSDYYFSCIRFNVPTSTIPLLIVPVQPYPNTDTTKTVYSVSLSYNGFNSAETFIVWSPVHSSSSETLSTPKKQLSAQSPTTNANDNYYYCNSYMYFMSLVNQAFKTAFSDLSGQTALPVGASAPYYTYNAITKLFTLVAPASVYDVNNVGTPINIYMNNDLWNLFGAMSCITTASPTIAGHDRQILITSDVANVDGSGNIQFQQEYISICQWMAMKSIIITTNSVPITTEGIPSVSNNYTPNNGLIGQATYLPIISSYDALVSVAGFEDFQSLLQYTPSGPLKYIQLNATNPLTTFDITVFWQDIYGGLHQLLIAPFESATFTFQFTRKNVVQMN